MSVHREIKAGVPQVSVFSPTLYRMYTNDTLQTPGVYLALFANDTCTCMYAVSRKGDYVLRKMQRGLDSIHTSCERWNIKIKEDLIGIFNILL
jgi:hypothetical protein